VTWKSVLARLIAYPLAVAVGDYLLAGIHFAAPAQWIAVGAVMAAISVAFDAVGLDRLGTLGSPVLYAILVAGIVRLTPSLMPQVITTRPGSIGMGVLLGLVRLALHWIRFGARTAVRTR
jgi:hypothetical protein